MLINNSKPIPRLGNMSTCKSWPQKNLKKIKKKFEKNFEKNFEKPWKKLSLIILEKVQLLPEAMFDACVLCVEKYTFVTMNIY